MKIGVRPKFVFSRPLRAISGEMTLLEIPRDVDGASVLSKRGSICHKVSHTDCGVDIETPHPRKEYDSNFPSALDTPLRADITEQQIAV